MSSEAALLSLLRPLEAYYSDEDHEEIAINQPGEIWCRLRKPDQHGRVWYRVVDTSLTHDKLLAIVFAVANTYDQSFHPSRQDRPCTVFGTLPPFDHRFSAIAGPNVVYDSQSPDGGIAINIRQGANQHSRSIEFSAWGLEEGKGIAEVPAHIAALRDPRQNAMGTLRDAIKGGVNLLVSGATGTGKTTFMNRVLEELDERLRIITLEDTREIKLPKHPNHVHLLLNRTKETECWNFKHAINFITRATPDLVMVGEISTENAVALWSLSGSGHGAMMTTIHADSPMQARETLLDRIAMKTPNINRDKMLADIGERFCVVQLERDLDNQRQITAIDPPAPPRHVAAPNKPLQLEPPTIEGSVA